MDFDSLDDFFDFDDFIHHSPPPPSDFLWSNPSVSSEIGFSAGGSGGGGSDVCQEKTKKRFCDLSVVLEPGRPAKADKMAILDDAIRVLKQLKTEAEELKQTNEKLLEEIKCSKAEKNELREEKLVLKVDKERIERQLKDLPIQPAPAGYMPPNLAPFQAGVNKVAVYPNYGYMPMWHYLPPSTRDTSHDHELRPPAA
ncbi:hypothetical protein Ahy_A09g043169 [Arachis hypogaea]|uniref:BHLH domain-containing protein n=1 Tax=Arachis hypogaea TaxID=3818 RepID=A0A445BHP0_ARAHY|nr:hypothetical protein Ahy_A09g043169 [Arachis hypogaea]